MLDVSAPGSAALAENLVDGCLDALFELGSIGTNVRPAQGTVQEFLDYKPSPEATGEFVDAVLVIYASFPKLGEAWMPPACRYRLLGAADGRELGGGSVGPLSAASAGAEDLRKACKATGAAIVKFAFPN